MSKPIYINGRHYPLWQQFVDKKDFFIGGILEDYGDDMDRSLGIVTDKNTPQVTEITDIKLEPNGTDSAMFSVVGKNFTCGFDVQHGGILGSADMKKDDIGWLTFSGYANHKFRIINKDKK